MNPTLIEREFDLGDVLYFNAAYFGPSPRRSIENIKAASDKESRPFFKKIEVWMDIPERVREKFSLLLGVDAKYISHATSTSDLISRVVNGYAFKQGDVVCSADTEYPSNVLPWMLGEKHLPFRLHLLKRSREGGTAELLTADWLSRELPQRCRVLNVSHVAFETGDRIDLVAIGKLCRERDILFVVDATQSLGGMALSKEELASVDVLAISTYKWMLAPYGHAFGYFSERAVEQISRREASWTHIPLERLMASFKDYTLETREGARMFDRGQAANFLLNAGLEGSLDVLLELGLKNIGRHNVTTRDHFLQNYPSKKYHLVSRPDVLSNIITLKPVSGDIKMLEKKLEDARVDVTVRGGNVRISFHLYNTIEQVNTLLKIFY